MERTILYRVPGSVDDHQGVLHGFSGNSAIVENFDTGEITLVGLTQAGQPSTVKLVPSTSEVYAQVHPEVENPLP